MSAEALPVKCGRGPEEPYVPNKGPLNPVLWPWPCTFWKSLFGIFSEVCASCFCLFLGEDRLSCWKCQNNSETESGEWSDDNLGRLSDPDCGFWKECVEDLLAQPSGEHSPHCLDGRWTGTCFPAAPLEGIAATRAGPGQMSPTAEMVLPFGLASCEFGVLRGIYVL